MADSIVGIVSKFKETCDINEIYDDYDDCSYGECSTIGGEVEGYHRDAVVEREASQGQKSGGIVRSLVWHKSML